MRPLHNRPKIAPVALAPLHQCDLRADGDQGLSRLSGDQGLSNSCRGPRSMAHYALCTTSGDHCQPFEDRQQWCNASAAPPVAVWLRPGSFGLPEGPMSAYFSEPLSS